MLEATWLYLVLIMWFLFFNFNHQGVFL